MPTHEEYERAMAIVRGQVFESAAFEIERYMAAADYIAAYVAQVERERDEANDRAEFFLANLAMDFNLTPAKASQLREMWESEYDKFASRESDK